MSLMTVLCICPSGHLVRYSVTLYGGANSGLGRLLTKQEAIEILAIQMLEAPNQAFSLFL
jgi:hypothetical protein